MIFQWLKNRRRQRILAEPFSETWERWIESNVLHDRQLTDEQRQRLRRLVQVFIAEKNWEGCGGLVLTDEMKVTIAAQACLLVVGMSSRLCFDHVLTILVYPSAYVVPETHTHRSGIVIDQAGQARLGEAWWRGPVILSWTDVLAGGRRETRGHNLVFHEFAHQLDMMNGRSVDGTPLLETREQFDRWVKVMEPELETLVEQCRTGRPGLIDCYGATSPAEFFAVITETYFERPGSLRQHHPNVYAALDEFYGLDPAGWNR